MRRTTNETRLGGKWRASARRGFTLMEMITAVALLVITIVAVGVIFRTAGTAVSLSQVSMEVISNVRAVQDQIQRDAAGLDQSGFLVIRSRVLPADQWQPGVNYSPGARVSVGGVTYRSLTQHLSTAANTPGAAGAGVATWQVTVDRADMLAFLSSGAFANRTGDVNGKFTDSTTANEALIIWGQGIWELPSGAPYMANAISPANEKVAVPGGALPSGSKDSDFVLMRRTLLLLASSGGGTLPYYDFPWQTDPATGTASKMLNPGVDSGAVIASSRWCAVGVTPNQLMQLVQNNKPGYGGRYEADAMCFRSKAVADVWSSEISPVNGALRMHPIAMKGVASFRVDWTDGTSSGANGPLNWYGMNDGKGVAPQGNAAEVATGNGDQYTAVFSFDNRADGANQPNWPKALRIWYRATDPSDRMRGGREFVQVVALPH